MDTILVQDIRGFNELHSVVLHEDASLEAVLSHLVRNPGLCGVFLVNDTGHVSGVVTRSTLVNWARICLSDLSERVPVGEIFRLVSAAKARDLAVGDAESLGVKPTDHLSKVLRQITTYNVGAIPVVESNGLVIGDITIGQVLMKAMEVRVS